MKMALSAAGALRLDLSHLEIIYFPLLEIYPQSVSTGYRVSILSFVTRVKLSVPAARAFLI